MKNYESFIYTGEVQSPMSKIQFETKAIDDKNQSNFRSFSHTLDQVKKEPMHEIENLINPDFSKGKFSDPS
jgi:hypothetical protein